MTGKKKDKKEIMAENFPNLERYLDIQVQGAYKSCYNFNSKWSSSIHIIKLPKIKVRVYKAVKYIKFLSYKEISIRLLTDFSAEILQI